jgi:GrpB-like predicted nucleotidyltransferase (UPF0157 family)
MVRIGSPVQSRWRPQAAAVVAPAATRRPPNNRPHRPSRGPVASTANPRHVHRPSREAILTKPVVIVDYDPSWPATFQQLRDRLAATLGRLAGTIEHVGSTAVPGLAAKPIIDLDVVIADRGDLPAVIQRLRPIGYHHEGNLEVPGREAFTSPAGAPAHHLYVCAVGTPALDRHLAFRDALRADPALVAAYGDLKRTLAARLSDDRNAYTEAKSPFIEQVLAASPRRR